MRYYLMLACAMFSFGLQAQTTFNVDMTCAPEGFTDVFVTGPWCGWCANDTYNTMTDADGDGIYSVTVADLTGLVEYKYAINGFADQENLINDMVDGASCAPVTDFAGYANRQIDANSTANDSYGTCDGTCNDNVVAVTTVDVTFSVDVNGTGYTSVSWAGTANGWNNAANFMDDSDGDGIYTITLALEPGAQEYKFLGNGDWAQAEIFDGSEECTTAPAEFVNRVWDVAEGGTNPGVVCYNSCVACDAGNTGGGDGEMGVTFNVDMTCAPEFDNVFVTGPWCGWCANDVYNTMTDDDGDGIYSVTVPDLTGVVEYKYAINGFADQENLVNDMVDGATCAPVTDFNGYANRQIDAGQTANDNYGTCDGTCNDAAPTPGGLVTFKVDMSQYAGTYGTVNLNGSFNGWCGACAEMTDADADGIYELAVDLPGGTVEYKFTLDGWNAQEEFTEGDACTSTIDGYTNRTLDVSGDVVLDAVCYNSCDACEPQTATEYAVTFRVDMGEQETNPIGVFIAGTFQGWQAGATAMTDEDGDDVWEYTAMIAEGEAVEYKFINGPNWGLDESIPVACAVNGNRGYTVGSEDAILDAVCFAACLPCGSSLPTEDVTFTVLTDNIEVAADGMYIAGAFNGWTGEAMMDNGDGSWSITKALEAATYEFKFQNGLNGWEELECGGNRSVVVELGAPVSVQGCFAQCSEICSVDPDPANVTFQVDASQIEVSADGLYLLGSFTEPAWQFGAVAMSDDDADGIWTATVNISGAASFQYKFNNGLTVVDSVAVYDGEEAADFLLEGCGVANGVGGFNRTHERSGVDEVLDVVCFNSCSACNNGGGGEMGVTFNVDMTCAPEFDNVFVTGPWCGWCANDVYNTMTDEDGDGIYSVTVPDLTGLVEYKYAINGFADQENLVNDMVEGATCAPVTDFSGYANRQIEAGSVANDSYGTCDGTCNDEPAPAGGAVTFKVDMAGFSGTYGTVNLNGSFNGWCGACAEMTDADGDGVYELTVDLPGGVIEYKFTVDGWTGQEEFVEGDPCTSTIDGYTNRTYDVTGDAALDVVCWNSCSACDTVTPDVYNVTFRVDMTNYEGAYGTVNLNGSFNGWCGACAEMTDADGDNVYELTVPLAEGTVEYKFTVDGWTGQEEFAGGESCTSTIDGYTNRTLTFAEDTVLDAVCWNSCEACVVIPEVLGCTNPEFLEYDPYATADDGSCSNLLVPGCMYENATNYNPLANDDDNSCEFEEGGNNDCPADLDGDGAVTTSDLLSFLAEFGASCS
ncbi:MAG: hypothetical protein ACPG56_00665 [Flavobacteriales bacterium]